MKLKRSLASTAKIAPRASAIHVRMEAHASRWIIITGWWFWIKLSRVDWPKDRVKSRLAENIGPFSEDEMNLSTTHMIFKRVQYMLQVIRFKYSFTFRRFLSFTGGLLLENQTNALINRSNLWSFWIKYLKISLLWFMLPYFCNLCLGVSLLPHKHKEKTNVKQMYANLFYHCIS